MLQPHITFLGDSHLTKSVNGCIIALTSYSGNADFEEWHSHKQGSISFLLTGSHEEDLFGKKHKRVTGNIKYIPVGELHRCNNYSIDARKINLNLDDAQLRKMNVTEDQITSLLNNSPQLKFTLLKLYHELDDTGSHSTASSELLLYELIFAQHNLQKLSAKNPPAWVNLLKQLLYDEWNQKFDLETLAAKIGLHPVSLSRYFPYYFSSTLGSYIKQIKIDKALSLIKITKLPLTAIAYQCGFADQAHFTRTFKEITGYLPKEFRKI